MKTEEKIDNASYLKLKHDLIEFATSSHDEGIEILQPICGERVK